MSDLVSPHVSDTARAKAEADFDYLPDDVRASVAQILTAMEEVNRLFSNPQADSYVSAKAALTAIEAKARRHLSQEEIARHYEDYRQAIAPYNRIMCDILAHYQRPIIIEAKVRPHRSESGRL